MLTKKLLILQLDVDVSPYDEGYKLNFSGIKHPAISELQKLHVPKTLLVEWLVSGGGGWVEQPFYASFKNSCYINCSFVHLLKVDFHQSEKNHFI